MRLGLIGLATALLANSAAAQTPGEILEGMRFNARMAYARVEAWDGRCDGRLIQEASGFYQANVDTVASFSASIAGPRYVSGHGLWAAEKVLEGAPMTAQLGVDIGQAYQSRGCAAEAERMYQHVLATFTGSRYMAHREQAMVGLTRRP